VRCEFEEDGMRCTYDHDAVRVTEADPVNGVPAKVWHYWCVRHIPGEPQASLFEPARPYTQEGQASAGYAKGSETSKRTEVARAGAQRQVLALVAAAGTIGLTGHEANDGIGKPKQTTGQSCLSTLHLDGIVERLDQERDGQYIYVLPENVMGRPTKPRGRHGSTTCWNCGAAQ
jgi:hypothetical protein